MLNAGCMGGLQYRAYIFAKKNGFFNENDYAYNSYQNKALRCRENASLNKINMDFEARILFNASVIEILKVVSI